jgi:hypothetical protein
MKVYAFDVDETLYLSHGPVQWEALVALRAEDHVLGLCGNWAAVTLQVPEWHRVLSFIGPSLIGTDKAYFLATIKQYVPAEEHVMVGNDHSLRAYASCRFRKLHPLDSRSLANQNMIAGCSQLPPFSSACCVTVSSRDDGLKPKSWCCGISSTSCNSGRHVVYV